MLAVQIEEMQAQKQEEEVEEGVVEVEPGVAVPNITAFTDPKRRAQRRRMILEQRGHDSTDHG